MHANYLELWNDAQPWIIQAAFILAMGLAWRVRGGLWALPSTTLARSVPAILMSLGCFWFSQSLWMLLAGPALFAATTMPWAQWMDMGTVEDNDDFVGMSGRGLLLTLPLGLLFYFMGHGIIVQVGGVLMGSIYWTSWKIRLMTPGGEVGTGFLLGSLVLLALQFGV